MTGGGAFVSSVKFKVFLSIGLLHLFFWKSGIPRYHKEPKNGVLRLTEA